MKAKQLYNIGILLFVLIIGFLILLLKVQPSEQEVLTQAVDAYLVDKHFQGSVLIARQGKILFCKGYGMANVEHQIPNASNTVFRIGSISKLFTAVAILQLEQRGMVKTSDPVSQYLPDYPQGDLITLHDLLAHRSGIPSIYHFPNLMEIQRQETTALQAMNHFKYLPLKFKPGTDTDSSDSGYIILGAVIEKVTGDSYEKYLKEAIFSQLNLTATYYEYNKYVIPHRASGYYLEEGNLYHAPFIDMSLPHAAGALSSTVEDLYKFDRSVRGSAFLSKKMQESLFTIHGSSSERKISAGYGYRIGPLNRGMEGCEPSIVGHFATIDGFEGAMISYLNDDLTIIMLSNVQKTDLRHFHKEIARIFYSSWRPRA